MKKILVVFIFISLSFFLSPVVKAQQSNPSLLVPCHGEPTYYLENGLCRVSHDCAVDRNYHNLCYCATDPEPDIKKCGQASSAFGTLTPPAFIQRLGFGNIGLGNVIGILISLFYALCALVLLLMLFIAGYNWITSQGDKEKLAKARSTLINAVIGMVIVVAAFFVTNQIILPALGLGRLYTPPSAPGPVVEPLPPRGGN